MKEIQFTDLMLSFIKASVSGKRKTKQEQHLRKSTIVNYKNVLKKITEYQTHSNMVVLTPVCNSGNKLIRLKTIKKWDAFVTNYKVYMHKNGSFDNHVAMHMRIIRTCLNWARIYKLLHIPEACCRLHLHEQQIEVIALHPEQLAILARSSELDSKLSDNQRLVKNIFLIGCVLGLRFSDLISLKKQAILKSDHGTYIQVCTRKTNTIVTIPIPNQFIGLLYKQKNGCFVFPQLALATFNKRLKEVGKIAGLVCPVSRIRSKSHGKTIENSCRQGPMYQFLSSHIMRRTAITTLLYYGVSEMNVRQITGHKQGSQAFYRYIQFAQDMIDASVINTWENILTH